MTAAPQTGLLRTAGLPIRIWLAAAAPELAATAGRLDLADQRYRQLARQLADRLGAEVVPSAGLGTAERRWVLAQRRALHQGRLVSSEACRRLEKLAGRASPADLADPASPASPADLADPASPASPDGMAAGLAEAGDLAVEVAELTRLAEEQIAAESLRLAAAPWELLASCPAGLGILGDPSLAPMADVARRVADGEPWTTKRMRRRSDYLWRMIGRGAVKTTPRGWLGHVALVPVTDGPPGPAPAPVALRPEAATEWMQNLHLARTAALASLRLGADSVLSLAPLQQPDGDHQQVWVTDPADPAGLTTWRLRRSAELAAITGALATGPAPLAELEARAFGQLSEPRRAAILGLLARLAGMGVIGVSAPPRQLRHAWQPMPRHLASPAPRPPLAGGAPAAAAAALPGPGYTDVYRMASGTPAVSLAVLREAVQQLHRVRALMSADAAASRPARPRRPGPRPRPLLEVFAERHQARKERHGQHAGEPHHHGTWPQARTCGSGYARLLAAMAGAADLAIAGHGGTAGLTADLLDSLGAPARRVEWPVDCLIRPLHPDGHVLSEIAPAGVLDARFTEMAEWLHGTVPHAEQYRAFLAELDQRTGIRSAELLIPSVSERAANAVRRPLYAGAWTGDSDPACYSAYGRWAYDHVAGRALDYLPLADLTVRYDGDRPVVEHKGREIRVLSHATRNPRYPWALISGLLLAGSPQRELRACRLRWTLAAYPERSYFPRVTVAGSIVISAAQWRVRPAELWDPGAPTLARLRALIRLRDRRGLPRWVFAARWPAAKGLPCDLESLRALSVLEEAGSPDGLLIEEMLPRPDELDLIDHSSGTGDPVASELMIRLAVPVQVAASRRSHGDLTGGGETDGEQEAHG